MGIKLIFIVRRFVAALRVSCFVSLMQRMIIFNIILFSLLGYIKSSILFYLTCYEQIIKTVIYTTRFSIFNIYLKSIIPHLKTKNIAVEKHKKLNIAAFLTNRTTNKRFDSRYIQILIPTYTYKNFRFSILNISNVINLICNSY